MRRKKLLALLSLACLPGGRFYAFHNVTGNLPEDSVRGCENAYTGLDSLFVTIRSN